MVFRVEDRAPEVWNPATGEMRRCGIYKAVDGGVRLPMDFETHGSRFVVFRSGVDTPRHITEIRAGEATVFPMGENQPAVRNPIVRAAVGDDNTLSVETDYDGALDIGLSDGSRRTIQASEDAVIGITGAWDVRFPRGWGAEPIQSFPELVSWTETGDEGLRAFSGIATCRKAFQLDGGFVTEADRLVLDLGEVREVARAYLNGVELGVSGFAPHGFDVSGIARPGDNFLVVEVANTWLNRLIADDTLPPEERLTHTNIDRGPVSGMRWRDAEPLPSGLLGPVRLLGKRVVEIGG